MIPPRFSSRLSRLASAIRNELISRRLPLVTDYAIFAIYRHLHRFGDPDRLGPRESNPSVETIETAIRALKRGGVLTADADFKRGAYRVLPVPDGPPIEIFSLAYPFGYVSHLSALSEWGLTERQPKALHVTIPNRERAASMVATLVARDYGPEADPDDRTRVLKPKQPAIPGSIRGVDLDASETDRLGRWIAIRDTHARLSEVGQTFADTLADPARCGGMSHVRDIWRAHATTYRDDIVAAIDRHPSDVVRVRAGYLLDEDIGLGDDPSVQAWLRCRAVSRLRKLDPNRPNSTVESEKWMLNVNV